MNTKNKAFRALVCSWIIVFVVGIIGGTAFGKFTSRNQPPPMSEPEAETETEESRPPYGTRDGRVFTDGGEMSMDWGGDELEFTPYDIPLDADIQEFIFYLSYGYYIDFPFVMGLIQAESSFKTDIISKTNDYGLMQINKQNHGWLSERLGLDNMLDPVQNVRAGLYILRTLFEKYDDPVMVLMAYNMGEYGAGRLWERGVYETSYTRKVMKYADAFREGQK